MENTTFSTILHHIHTTHDVDILLRTIDTLLEGVYQTQNKGLDGYLSFELPSEISSALKENLTKQGVTWENKEAIQKVLTALKAQLHEMTLLTLTISFSPSDQAISRFSAKTKELFGEMTILEINVQESVLAGAIIVYKGMYLDKSLKTRLDQVFKVKSNDIKALLN